jgi:hypothetical protein
VNTEKSADMSFTHSLMAIKQDLSKILELSQITLFDIGFYKNNIRRHLRKLIFDLR